MFCENANQAHICHSLVSSQFFPSHVEPEVLVLDWDKETTAWVVQSVTKLGWEVSVSNIYDGAPSLLKKALLTAKSGAERKAALIDIAFDQLKQHVSRSDALLVQFNDASLRGGAIAQVCRNIGMRRLLLQDGFLNFVSKTSNLAASDQNYRWGSTSPELVAVWGGALKEALVQRHSINPSTVTITGPVKREIGIPTKVVHLPSTASKLKVLWADQAILDQGKAPREEWLNEFAEIAARLEAFETTLRLHPSTKEASRASLQDSVGDRFSLIMTGDPKIDRREISDFDVVVTYYSTIFLDCLANNVPCVIYKTRSLDIELPNIDHPLLSYCSKIDDLPEAVRLAARSELSGETPSDIFRYIANSNGVDAVAKVVAGVASADEGPTVVKTGSIVRDIEIAANLKRLLGRKILVIGGSFGNHVGVGKPIRVFVEYLRDLDLDIEFHLATAGDRENLLRKISEASLVVLNSFDVIRILRERDLSDAFKICEMRSVPMVFYCHETLFVYNRLLAEVGGKVDAFVKNILPRSHALAVSDRQADWLGSLGCRSVRTVYNSIGSKFLPVGHVEQEDHVILMVGTQQRRKGVDLFSHVADIAKKRGLNWRFVWLGAYTKNAEGCYKSDAVEWVGHVSPEQVREWLSKATVFFLSSVDDPFPLSVGEALMSGIPGVVYSETGFSDFISLHRSGEVFSIYDPSVAFEKVSDVVERSKEYRVDPSLVMNIVGVDAFAKRMLVSLGEILAASAPDYVASKRVSGSVAFHRVMKQGASAGASSPKRAGLKWRVLYGLEKILPGFVVRPGTQLLKKVGII